MKDNIFNFVSSCLTCQQVKLEHKRPRRLIYPLLVSEWKWLHISMDFVVDLSQRKNNHDAIWAIVGELTNSKSKVAQLL